MKTPLNAISQVVEDLLRFNAVKAVKYLAPNQIVRATRVTWHGKIQARSNVEIILTIGRPNFLERHFIKLCQKAKEPFPVKKVQLKMPPKRKVAPKKK